MKRILWAALCGLAVGCNESSAPPARARSTQHPTTVAVHRPAIGEHPAAATEPVDQNENKDDIKITAEIRKRVVETKMLIEAHNVKIITQDGKVTLRGLVKTEDEKERFEEIAMAIVGSDRVDNQLEVGHE